MPKRFSNRKFTCPTTEFLVFVFWVIGRRVEECCRTAMQLHLKKSYVKNLSYPSFTFSFSFTFSSKKKESKSKSGSRRCLLQRWSRSASAPHLSTQPTLFASAFPTTPYSNVPFGIASSTCWPWSPTRSWSCWLVYSAMASTRRTETLWGAPCSRYSQPRNECSTSDILTHWIWCLLFFMSIEAVGSF